MKREWLGDDENETNEAIGIVRVSSHRQRDNISHETQEKEMREYAAISGLSLVRVEQLVESAKDSDFRVKYAAAMAHALTNGIRHILFYMYDREARNLTDNEKNEKLVKAGLVVIHYVRDRKVLHKRSSDSDFFIRDVQAAANKQYSRSLSVKINDAMKAKAEQGWFPSNHVPLGYKTKRMQDVNGNESPHGRACVIRDPDQRRVRWVTMEFELRARGFSYPEIREMVIESGLLTPKEEKAYYHGTIEYRIKNPFYEGYFLWKGIRYRGKHELIIPLKTLKAAREHTGLQKRADPKTERGIFAGGWMRCAECDCLITYDQKRRVYRNGNEARFHYYRCSNGKRMHASLAGRYVLEDALWKQFEAIVDRITLTPEVARRIADALNVTERQAARESAHEIEKLEWKLKELTIKEDRAYDDMLAQLIDPDAFRRQRDKIRAERMKLSMALESARAAISGNFRENAATIIELATNAKSLFMSRNAHEKREFLENVVSNLRLRGVTIEYDLKKPWGMLMEMQSVNEVVVPSGQLYNLIKASTGGFGNG